MRRAPAWMAVLGVLFAWLALPAAAHAAGVWVTLAAGIPGSDAPTSSSEFLFDNPHAPYIAVTQLTGGVSAEAKTGGGSSFFGGAGTPVLLNLGDGSAYIANGGASPAAKTAGAGGGTPASTAPAAGGTIPSNAALLGVNVAETNNGTRTLTASITDASGNPLGSGTIEVPDGGWWVIGLGPNDTTPPTPPIPPPDSTPSDPPPPDDKSEPPVTTPPPNTGGVATPEPTTFALAAIGGAVIHSMRRIRGR